MYRSDKRIWRTRIESSVVKVLHSRYTCEKARGERLFDSLFTNHFKRLAASRRRQRCRLRSLTRHLRRRAIARGENKVNRRIWQRRFQLLACQLLSQRETRSSHFSTRQRAHSHTHTRLRCDKRIKPCEQSSLVNGLLEVERVLWKETTTVNPLNCNWIKIIVYIMWKFRIGQH